MVHEYYASHHGSGPWDSVGKDPRKLMDDEVAFGRLDRYDYWTCFEFCVSHMQAPVSVGRSGDFCANGEYYWFAFSDGSDLERLNRDGLLGRVVVLPKERTFQPVKGSNELYCMTARNRYAPELLCQFVSCHCSVHRSVRDFEEANRRCPYRSFIFSNSSQAKPQRYITHETSIHTVLMEVTPRTVSEADSRSKQPPGSGGPTSFGFAHNPPRHYSNTAKRAP